MPPQLMRDRLILVAACWEWLGLLLGYLIWNWRRLSVVRPTSAESWRVWMPNSLLHHRCRLITAYPPSSTCGKNPSNIALKFPCQRSGSMPPRLAKLRNHRLGPRHQLRKTVPALQPVPMLSLSPWQRRFGLGVWWIIFGGGFFVRVGWGSQSCC